MRLTHAQVYPKLNNNKIYFYASNLSNLISAHIFSGAKQVVKKKLNPPCANMIKPSPPKKALIICIYYFIVPLYGKHIIMHRSLLNAHQQPLSFTLSSRNSNSPSTVHSHVAQTMAHTCPRSLPTSAEKLSYKYRSSSQTRSVSDSTETAMSPAMEEALDDAQKLRDEFLKVLRSRRSGEGEWILKLSETFLLFLFGYWESLGEQRKRLNCFLSV